MTASTFFFFFQAEDGIRDSCLSRGLGDVYKRQVWTNLIDNAVDAMSGGGAIKTLTVRTARDPIGVLVEIADTGPGVPPEIQPRIYDPFFTTKPVGEGTGLGLDAVSRIVLKHGGNIRLESEPGDTRFQVRI